MKTKATTKKPRKRQPRPSTVDGRERFLRLLAETFSVTAAAEGSGLERGYLYRLRGSDPAFAAQWDDAIARAIDGLEAAAYKRATQMSDTLLIFLLKTRRPDLYRDRQDVTTTAVNVDYSNLTDEQLQRIANGEHPASVIASTPRGR